ncbi:MAG: YraN family protein [Candidatus Yanofskybacteria bacterium]|nr:YraN family protein [Candidatus Yanofskybacteria bacterium]
MAIHNEVGKRGEMLARKYLEGKGYKILEQNYKTKRGEVDIIAKHNDTLVFVEVRTKRHEQFGTPEDTINYHKKRKMMLNAKAYTVRSKHNGLFRIDAICAIMTEYGVARITHYEDICG